MERVLVECTNLLRYNRQLLDFYRDRELISDWYVFFRFCVWLVIVLVGIEILDFFLHRR